jgi:hypothetical protein
VSLLDSALRTRIAHHAPGRIFVHAGAVAIDGRALLVPGASFAGKTTLVAALVREGAAYLSDEFAVLDESGQVHPYPRPLSLRPGGPQFGGPVEAPGDQQAGPRPVGAIVVTSYEAGGRFEPRRISAGSGALALLANAVPARERPGETLRAARAAASRAVVLEGSRGEADEAAGALVELARRQAAVGP